MHINVGDKFVAVKKMWFLDEGTVINVIEVEDDGVSFAIDGNSTTRVYMDFKSFGEHFEKIVEKEEAELPAITEEYIRELMENCEFEVTTVFDKCTIVSCRMPNGFVIVESSACVSPENYDEEMGVDICLDKIADKIWELEAYRLQQALWEEECACCCENCDGRYCLCNEECEEDCDECLVTDLDCDDCDDYECEFNPNR